MTTTKPLDAYSEVVDDQRRFKPDWYSWLEGIAEDLTALTEGGQGSTTENNVLTYIPEEHWDSIRDGTVTEDLATYLADAWDNRVNAGDPYLFFPSGVYPASEFPNFAVVNARVVGQGRVFLRYTGTEDAVVLDGGPSVVGAFDVTFGPFIIQCPKTAKHALRIRNVNSSLIDRVWIKGAGWNAGVPGYYGFYVLGCVLTTFINPMVYPDLGGVWYDDARPQIGMLIDQHGPGAQTAFSTIIDCNFGDVDYGLYCLNALGNVFLSGAVQACRVTGAYLDTPSIRNRFYGFDAEQNNGQDLIIAGYENEFMNMDTTELVTITGGAVGTRLHGGTHQSIVIDPAHGTFLGSLIYNRLGTLGAITDNGTNTIKRDCVNGSFHDLDPISFSVSAGIAKVGLTAGWVVNAATNISLATLAESLADADLVIPLSGLQVGDQLNSVTAIGVASSSGNAVSGTLSVRKMSVDGAMADELVDSDTFNVGTSTDLSGVLSVTGLTEVVGANEMFYAIFNATTNATTTIDLMGLSVSVRRYKG